MSLINEFLISLTIEQRSGLYNFFLAAGCAVNLLATLYLCRKHDVDKKKQLWFALVCVVMGVLSCKLSRGTENSAFLPSSGNSMLMYLLLCSAAAMLFRIPVRKSWDITLPAYMGARGVVILGCMFPGCCHGNPVEWGFYSNVAKRIVFPCNQLESVLTFLLVFACFRFAAKRSYAGDGKVCAFALIGYGIMRFVTDLLRGNTKLFGQTSFDGIVAIVMCVVGLVLLYIVDNKKTQESSAVTEACTN